MNYAQKPLFAVLLLVVAALTAAAQATDSRYDAGLNLPFNQKAGDVNPQSGNITLGYTDVSLTGRAGLNFVFARSWSLNQSNVFAMGRNSNDNMNFLTSDTIEAYNHLGVGWSSSLPYIFEDRSSRYSIKNLVFNGSVYELEDDTLTVYNENLSNIEGYDLLDLRVYSGRIGGAVSYRDFNGTSLPSDDRIADSVNDSSAFVLILKDNSKYYFRPDGRLMMQQDKTSLNRIWYFYEDYTDENRNSQSRLALAVDTLGREIVFSYSPKGTLASISWEVEAGVKNPDGSRERKSLTRRVEYGYLDAEDVYEDVRSLSGGVVGKLKPYALTTVTDPLGGIVRYGYRAGRAGFSYESAFSRAENVYLLLTSVTHNEEGDVFRSREVFEYDPPPSGMHSKRFYSGYMEYYKISRRYHRDRHDSRDLNDTRYIYHDLGDMGDSSEYQTLIQEGGVTRTYVYTESSDTRQNHVLDRLITRSGDGFLERVNHRYDKKRAKILEEMLRGGTLAYTEHYSHDEKGNLVRKTDRSGLVTAVQYDSKFSIPIEMVKTLISGGKKVSYRTTAVINDLGQITEEWLYLEGGSRPVRKSLLEYDQYGNVITQTDARGSTVHTIYDSMHQAFPVKAWQSVGIASWSGGSVHNNWLDAPDGREEVNVQSWSIYNDDGTPWMEIDSAGYTVEHYYNALGEKIETVHPDDDDTLLGRNAITDIWEEYLEASHAAYFAGRKNNPGVRREIDYTTDYIRTISDIDASAGEVHVTAVQGNGLGQVEEEIEYRNGSRYSVKTMSYDAYGRMIALTDPDANEGFVSMEIQGTKINRHDKTWIVRHDDLGRTKRVIYPQTAGQLLHVKEYSYDDVLNTVSIVDPERRTIVERRDWSDNLVELRALGDPDTPKEDHQVYLYEYDELNRKVKFVDPEGISTVYRYDERDLLVEQNYGNASDLMEYDDLGLLTKKTDRKGQVITFEYDEMGRSTRSVHYRKDGDGNNIDDYKEGIIDEEVSTAYDLRGNVVRVAKGSLIEHYRYDAAGRVASLERHLKDAGLRKQLTDRVWAGEADDQVLSFEYQYNDGGKVTQMTYPDGAEHSFEYDSSLGLLASIGEGGEDFVSSLEYNRSGVVTRMDYANGTHQSWAFDNRKRISHIAVTSGNTTITDLSYTLNGVGDVLKINDNEYRYDGFDRIVGATTLIPGETDVSKLVAASFGTQQGVDPIEVEGKTRIYNPAADLNQDGRINGIDHAKASRIDPADIYDVESFSYDRNGNRKTLIQNGDKYEYHYGERNRLESIYVTEEGGTEGRLFTRYWYDANGNTVKREVYPAGSETQVLELEYDTMNRLVKSVLDGEATTYSYDNAGNRLVKETPEGTTVYLRHGQIAVAMDIELPVDVSEQKSRVNRYVLSGDLLAGRVSTVTAADGTTSEEKSYYHLDHLNSTKAVTDESGELEVIYEYRAFGEQLKRLDAAGVETEDSAKYSYGGKELEDTELYYFNARYYDAAIGRFVNVDPIQDGSNWYVYVSNNPLGFVDPTGLLERDSDGNIVFTPVGGSIIREHPAAKGTDFRAQPGVIKTDNGPIIKAYASLAHDQRMDTNCHGYTFADGKYWINGNQVETILAEDNYIPQSIPAVGDVVAHRRPDGRIEHTTTVRSIDVSTGAVIVEGIGGLETAPHQDNVNAAWNFLGRTFQYYRKSSLPGSSTK